MVPVTWTVHPEETTPSATITHPAQPAGHAAPTRLSVGAPDHQGARPWVLLPRVLEVTAGSPVVWVAGRHADFCSAPVDARNPHDYADLLAAAWALPGDLIVIEGDVWPTTDQLDTICTCGHDWCGYTYTGRHHGVGPTLGCTRFSARLRAARPSLAAGALLRVNNRAGRARWEACDSRLANALRITGHTWTRHTPDVWHTPRGDNQ